jgi:hypothetical protein
MGCLTEERSEGTVTYRFAGCTGPHQVGPITGALTITTESSTGMFRFGVKSDELRIRDVLTAFESVTVTTVMLRKRETRYEGTLSAKSLDGKPLFSRTVTKTVHATLGQTCVSISGGSTGLLGDAMVQVELLDGFTRCGRCPTAESKLRVTTPRGSRILDAAALCAARG